MSKDETPKEHTHSPIFECEKYSEAFVEVAKLTRQFDTDGDNWSAIVAQKNANKLRDLLRDLRDNEAVILKGETL